MSHPKLDLFFDVWEPAQKAEPVAPLNSSFFDRSGLPSVNLPDSPVTSLLRDDRILEGSIPSQSDLLRNIPIIQIPPGVTYLTDGGNRHPIQMGVLPIEISDLWVDPYLRPLTYIMETARRQIDRLIEVAYVNQLRVQSSPDNLDDFILRVVENLGHTGQMAILGDPDELHQLRTQYYQDFGQLPLPFNTYRGIRTLGIRGCPLTAVSSLGVLGLPSLHGPESTISHTQLPYSDRVEIVFSYSYVFILDTVDAVTF